MKKQIFALIPAFTVLNAAFLGLGLECLLNLMSAALASALFDGKSPFEEYPRFLPFCLVAGGCALLGLIGILFANIKLSEKLKYTKAAWAIQYIGAFVLSIPAAKLFEMLFDFLQKTF